MQRASFEAHILSICKIYITNSTPSPSINSCNFKSDLDVTALSSCQFCHKMSVKVHGSPTF